MPPISDISSMKGALTPLQQIDGLTCSVGCGRPGPPRSRMVLQ